MKAKHRESKRGEKQGQKGREKRNTLNLISFFAYSFKNLDKNLI